MQDVIFISLPTNDVEKATRFYTDLGWKFNPQMSDERGVCFSVTDTVYLMIMDREFMATFTTKKIVDPSETLQTQVAISADTREEVNAFIEKVMAAGGAESGEAQDYDFMYTRDFEDPAGNHFAIQWMAPEAIALGPEEYMAQQAGKA